MPFPLLFPLLASPYLHLATATPISTIPSLSTRATYNCTNTSAEPSPLCWDELSLPTYLSHWNITTHTCQSTGRNIDNDGANCCAAQEPWTTCFLRLAYGSAGMDCTGINPQGCVLRPLSPDLDAGIVAKVGYVVRNIVGINNLLVEYYYALQAERSSISGSDSEAAILAHIMRNGATLNNGNIVKASLAGLPFWGTSSVLAGGPQQIKANEISAAGQAFAQSLQNTQVISSLFFGTSYENSQEITVDSTLASRLDDLGNQLASALRLIMSDMPTFIAWAAHGLYSGPTDSVNIPAAATGIISAFSTYLTSEILSQSHFSATPSLTTISKEAFQQSRICTTLGDVCKDSQGRTYYWSQAYQTEYLINEPKGWASGDGLESLGYETSPYGLLEYIETTDTYMPVLFDGAYNCTLEGKAGGSVVSINADGSLDMACLSSLPIYLSKGSSCPGDAVQVGGKCPFGFNS